jgi:hypothetical protein
MSQVQSIPTKGGAISVEFTPNLYQPGSGYPTLTFHHTQGGAAVYQLLTADNKSVANSKGTFLYVKDGYAARKIPNADGTSRIEQAQLGQAQQIYDSARNVYIEICQTSPDGSGTVTYYDLAQNATVHFQMRNDKGRLVIENPQSLDRIEDRQAIEAKVKTLQDNVQKVGEHIKAKGLDSPISLPVDVETCAPCLANLDPEQIKRAASGIAGVVTAASGQGSQSAAVLSGKHKSNNPHHTV